MCLQALDGFRDTWDEIVTSLQLDIDVRPRASHALSQAKYRVERCKCPRKDRNRCKTNNGSDVDRDRGGLQKPPVSFRDHYTHDEEDEPEDHPKPRAPCVSTRNRSLVADRNQEVHGVTTCRDFRSNCIFSFAREAHHKDRTMEWNRFFRERAPMV